MATVISVPDRRKLRKSRNLRGLLDYARVSPVEKIVLGTVSRPGEYSIVVEYANGARGVSQFADWRVLRAWVQSRRSWHPCEVVDLLPIYSVVPPQDTN